jgi:triphosphoribosyl-dephospho-CoA synthase
VHSAIVTTAWSRSELERAVLGAMIGEVDALKPGNVHRYAAGHGMRYEDFITSAELCTPILCDPALSIGRRVLKSVQAVRKDVGQNTNLGIVLLFAPLIAAAEASFSAAEIEIRARQVIAALQQSDADDVFSAIRLAAPGGLGHVPEYDVHSDPRCSLSEAMAAAADRDMIARQYAAGFPEVCGAGLAAVREFMLRWHAMEWAATGCYLRFLACFPDSHIVRKHGPETAEQVRNRAAGMLQKFEINNNPGSLVAALLDFDKELKDAGINPGTSADLTAASLLLYELGV